jgi:hypothetical protein
MKNQIAYSSIVSLLILLLAPVAHADVLQNQPPPTKALEAAIQTLDPPSDRQKLDSLVPNIKPVVIFLPGIPTPKTRCIPGKVKLRPPASDLRRS